MKTAVSIPDKLFSVADLYAKKNGVSRSHLYAKALAQFLEQHPADYITEQLNKVYSDQSSEPDQGIVDMQLRTVEKEDW